jgi:hypothetical protein
MYSTGDSLLEQRLQAIEKRLRLSEPNKQFDESLGMHTSPSVHESHESQLSPGLKGPLIKAMEWTAWVLWH